LRLLIFVPSLLHSLVSLVVASPSFALSSGVRDGCSRSAAPISPTAHIAVTAAASTASTMARPRTSAQPTPSPRPHWHPQAQRSEQRTTTHAPRELLNSPKHGCHFLKEPNNSPKYNRAPKSQPPQILSQAEAEMLTAAVAAAEEAAALAERAPHLSALVLGCGMSTAPLCLYEHGFKRIVCIDVSPKVLARG